MILSRMLGYLLLVLGSCVPAYGASIFETGGCLPLTEFRKQQAAAERHEVATFVGNSTFLQVLEDYRLDLSVYRVNGVERMVLSVDDMPIDWKSTDACVLFMSDGNRSVMGDLSPNAAPVQRWAIPLDAQAIRTYCAEKILPALIAMENRKKKMVGGVWMTEEEAHLALGKTIGLDVESERKKWRQPDVDRLERARTNSDAGCTDIDAVIERNKKQGRKLSMLVSGNHLRNTGASFSAGALAVFVPTAQSAQKNLWDWELYMVFRDGRSYRFADGNSLKINQARVPR